MQTSKTRHQFYLPDDLSAKLDAMAARPGSSKTAILTDALTAWFDRRAANELDQRFGIRRAENFVAKLDAVGTQHLRRLMRDRVHVVGSLAHRERMVAGDFGTRGDVRTDNGKRFEKY